MADVTDVAFRTLVAEQSRHGKPGGGPDVFWTEFVSADGLLSEGREQLLRDLEYWPSERPIVAQIFGSTPDNIRQIARDCEALGFDGIDINAGCPDKSICGQGAGCGLIKTPTLAQELIQACKEGAPNTPISIKTRLGWSTDESQSWIRSLLKARPAALTVHVRTKKDMSKTCPEWGRLKSIVEMRNSLSPETLILANGGIRTKQAGREIANFTGCEGIMMGKAVFGNPWLFDDERPLESVTIRDRLVVLLEHTRRFMREIGEQGPGTQKPTLRFGETSYSLTKTLKAKNIALMKKHYKGYVHGFPGAKELRGQLMESDSYGELENLVLEWIANHPNMADTTPTEEYIA
jgi:tRNA-dihydrouridine synthase